MRQNIHKKLSIYLSFFSISSFSNSSFFVIFSDKIRIQICIKHHHHSPFLTTKNAKETKIRCCKRYFTQVPPILSFLYITRTFSSFLLISLLISSALFRKIETLFLKKEPQQHKDVSIITVFVQMGCT